MEIARKCVGFLDDKRLKGGKSRCSDLLNADKVESGPSYQESEVLLKESPTVLRLPRSRCMTDNEQFGSIYSYRFSRIKSRHEKGISKRS